MASAALPASASAHGLVGKQDLPIPRWLFAWAAAVVLVVSFVALATLWPRPRLERAVERRVWRAPAALEVLCGALGVAAFVVTVWAGFAGTQTATANLVPTVVYVVFWVGIPFATLLLGDVFAAFNPWRAVGAGRGVGLRPPARRRARRRHRWPTRRGWGAGRRPWGSWPSRGSSWSTSTATTPASWRPWRCSTPPSSSLGMSVYGIEPWSRNADAFGVYFRLFSMLSPLHWRKRELYVRAPLAGAPRLDVGAGTVALLCTMIGTVSFDGLSQGALWTGTSGVAPKLQQRFINLGFTGEVALEITFTIGLLFMVGVVSGVYRLGVVGMHSVGRGHTTTELSRRFVHSLIPIALAYVIAHYFSLLTYQGQAMAYLISDPLGHGSNLFGTATATINYNVIGANGVWYVQVLALVLGHACGLTLAHDRALVVYQRVRDATRSQYWMLAVMVAFTSLGLWLLSAAAQ